jgi:3',5'-cyclic AMP phosphodiesterase CpdA
MRCRNLFALATALLAGCAPSPSPAPAPGPHPWTHLKFDNDPNQFHFAIVGDRTGQHRPGVFEKGIAALNLIRPEFVMSVGDMIEGYTRDELEIDQEWDEIAGFTSKLDAPYFYVPGNHDLSNPIQKQKWRDRFGPAYYHFVYKNVLFLCLNTYDPESHLAPAQIAYVAKALKDNPCVRWTCVFMHEPLWDYKQETGFDKIEELLKDRPYTVFAGHYHVYTKYVRHDRRYIVLATTGGGMKQGMNGPELGSFDHVTWVTMLPDGPRIANIELDAIYDEDVRTEAMAKLIDAVLRGDVLHISPVLVDSDSFEKSEMTLTFTNDSDVPMRAQGTLPASRPLHATPDSFDVRVGPKKESMVTVELRADGSARLSDLSAMPVKWTATYDPAGRKPVRVPREDLLAVEKIAACPARTAPVVVDGNLDEWNSFPFSAKASDAKDCSYQFAVEHDEKFVYVAVKTTDDRAILNPNKEPWSQDGIEVRLDARPEPQRSQGRGHGEFKDILVLSMSPGITPDKMVLYGADQIPAGVKAICVKTPTGHNTEIAIPVSYLNEKRGGEWTQFRLNVAVNDFDEVVGPLKALWWRPDWRYANTFAGSGTFEKK